MASQFFASILLLSSLSQAATMSNSQVIQNVPVAGQNKTISLTLKAEKPGDQLLRARKRSLEAVSRNSINLTDAQILKAFTSSPEVSLSPNKLKQLSGGGYKVFGNFIHGMKTKRPFDSLTEHDEAQFWKMVIPQKAQVIESILQVEWFSEGIGGHAQIRLKLDSPVLLISQDDPKVREILDGDMVYTLMALRTQTGNQVWGAMTGLVAAFANSYSLASVSHMAFTQAQDSYIEQYKLNLDAQSQQNLFSYILGVGPQVGERELYNVVYNSCIQAAMRALNAVYPAVDKWMFNTYTVVPHLRSIGLISNNQKLMSVNEEFGSHVRQLENETNRENIQFVRNNFQALTSPAFNESVKFLARVVIEDNWKLDELNVVVKLIEEITQANKTKGKRQDPAAIAITVATSLSKSGISDRRGRELQASILRLTTGIIQILDRNGYTMDQLIRFLRSTQPR